MKILVCCPYFFPHKGGVENYVLQTSKRLVSLGHKVFVVTSRLKNSKRFEVISGVNVIRVPGFNVLPGRFSVQFPFFSKIVARIGRPDVIVSHTRFYPLSFFAGVYCKLFGVPWVHVEHGSSQVSYSNSFVRFFARLADSSYGRWVLRNSRLVCVSRASCEFARSFGAAHCGIVHNGVDAKFFSGKLRKHSRPTIIFVGRLIREKGVQDLLKAVRGLDCDVVIVGRGVFENHLRAVAGSNVRFVGELDSIGVRDVLSRSDILVNPSYGEGLPSSVLEAGAMGLAVVASDVGGTSEIIVNGKTGFLVHPGRVNELRAKISLLLRDSKLRARFGSAIQKRVRESFDWDGIVLKFVDLLKSVVSRSPNSKPQTPNRRARSL